MKKENLLIVCYENMNIENIIEANKYKYNIHISSYDITLINKYKNHEEVINSFFLEQNVVLFDISDEVLDIVKVINQDIDKYFDKDLFFGTHIEGGFTSQAIQDIVLFSKSLKNIIKKYKIINVIDIYNKEFYQQSRYIENYCIEDNINYKKINFTLKNNFHFLKIKKYLYEPYRFYQYIKFKITNSKKSTIKNKSIVISLLSDKTKFLNLIKTFVEIVHTKTNYEIVYLTQTVDKNSTQVNHIKDSIILLEHQISLVQYVRSFFKFLKDIYIYHKKKGILKEKYISTYGYQYSHEILEALKANIYINSAYKYRYNSAMNLFIDSNYNKILALKLWGGVGLYEGIVTAKYIKENYPCIYTFDFHIGINLIAFPYKPKNTSNYDFVFVDSEYEKISYLDNMPKDKIILFENFKQNSIISDFMLKYSRFESLSVMKINKSYKHYVLIDIQAYVPGLSDLQEIIDFVYLAKTLASAYNEFYFLIKPHPAFKHKSFLEEHVQDIKNIQIFTKTDPILHLLNVADIVITKFSTIGLEAILFEKIVISMIYNDKRWKNFGEGAIYINKFDEITHIFDDFENIQNHKKKDILLFKKMLTTSNDSIKVDTFIKELKYEGK